MSNCHCTLRNLLIGIILVASPAVSAPQDQMGDKSKKVSPKIRREARELALRYRRANADVELRGQIAEEAIQLGIPYAEKVLGVAALDKTKSLTSYGVDFSKQIDKADVITAKGVVSSSKKLQKTRGRLIQLAKIEDKLRTFLDPNLKQEAGVKKNNDEETEQKAKPGFEELLQSAEVAAVEKWLSQQGYRSLTGEEISVIADINRLRQEAGLEKLEVDYKLCFAARDHSRDMVSKQFFSHKSPVRGKKTVFQRARRLGTLAFAENIAHCIKGESPVTSWLNSGPHKKNMLGKGFNTIGVGGAGNRYTAMFGRKIPAKIKKATGKNDR